MQLTPEQIEFYDQQGYLAGIKAMEESDVLPYREQFDALQAEGGRTEATHQWARERPHLLNAKHAGDDTTSRITRTRVSHHSQPTDRPHLLTPTSNESPEKQFGE